MIKSIFNNLSLRYKILILLLIISIISIVAIGYLASKTGRAALEEEAFAKLTAIREMKASQVEEYFQFITDQIITLSEDQMIIDAMKSFDKGIHTIDNDVDILNLDIEGDDSDLLSYYENEFLPRLNKNILDNTTVDEFMPSDKKAKLLQKLYISQNKNKTGEKHLLDDAGDGSYYSLIHSKYHPIIRNYLEKFGYYDIFLVDVGTGGHITYTVFKEIDFGTSITQGPYKDTNFNQAYTAAANSDDKDFVKIVDFEPYAPSYNAPAAFISSPIYDGPEKIGVLVFQLPIDKINSIMTNNQQWTNVGLGISGETYIVGSDYKLRNQSRFLIEDRDNYFEMIKDIGVPSNIIDQINNFNSTIGLQDVRTIGTESALKGTTDTRIFPDYRGVSVLSAYRPLNIQDVDWVLMSEIDESEAFLPLTTMTKKMVTVVILLIILTIIVSILFSKTLTKPIESLTEASLLLTDGDMDSTISVSTADEIGVLANSFDKMRVSMKDLIENLEYKVSARTHELNSQKEMLETTIESLQHPFYVIDANDYSIRLANNAALEVGKSGATTCYALTHRNDKPCDSKDDPCPLVQVKKSKKPFTVEHVHYDKDGNQKYVEVHGYPIFDDKKNVIEMIEYSLDITEKKKLEKALEDANKRMKGELDIGREIQMSMLPLIFPAFTEHEEFSIYADLIPAREVGGDFYDFYFVDDDRFCFVIGDVSGKGVPAALFMAVTKTLVKSKASENMSTGDILTHVNNELSQDNKASMFVTLFIGMLNVNTGKMIYTNAGHNPSYVRKANGDSIRLDTLHGPVLGAMEDLTYGETEIEISKGDSIIMYTDGVTEALDLNNNLYGELRLKEFIERSHTGSVEEMINSLVKDVKKFEAGAEQADDITTMALRFIGRPGNEETDKLDITIKNGLPAIDDVNSQFSTFCEKHSLPISIVHRTNMVFDELLNNIISYGFTDEEVHLINVKAQLLSDRMIITIIDDGVEFNPFEIVKPDTDATIEEREIGGLGIHLVRNMMDSFTYERSDNKNIVRLTKYIS